MEKSILAAYTPPLRNKVRKPAGFPTPFGVGLPGLILCSGQVRPQTKCRLGKGPAGPFPLPLSPRATLQALRASSPQGEPLNLFSLHSEGGEIRKISHAEHRNSLESWFGAASEGERSEPGGRAFQRRQRSALSELNKPTETPEQLEELVRCGDWRRALPSPLPPTHGATLQSGSTPDSSPERGAFGGYEGERDGVWMEEGGRGLE